MADAAAFPFGRRSTARPPRRPLSPAQATVVGVYPSALHVRWEPPLWARDALGVGAVRSLAVDDEPTVFWDGVDADRHLDRWRADVGFNQSGRDWGKVHAVGNGTSGRPVIDRVLRPLGLGPDAVWFTDVVNTYFVKRGGRSGGGRQQGDAIEQEYNTFARACGLPISDLPSRPPISALVELASREHRDRLRAELCEAAAPVVISLGEEARRVVVAITDRCDGQPACELSRKTVTPMTYGAAGSGAVGNYEFRWIALVHPGQRNREWATLQDVWVAAGDEA